MQEARAAQSSRVKCQVKRGLSAKDQRFSANVPISGIISSIMFNSFSSFFTMSQQFDPNVIMYLDEASIVKGSNGKSTLPLVMPQMVEEPKMGLVPQAQAQLVAGLFSDQRILVNAPQ